MAGKVWRAFRRKLEHEIGKCLLVAVQERYGLVGGGQALAMPPRVSYLYRLFIFYFTRQSFGGGSGNGRSFSLAATGLYFGRDSGVALQRRGVCLGPDRLAWENRTAAPFYRMFQTGVEAWDECRRRVCGAVTGWFGRAFQG